MRYSRIILAALAAVLLSGTSFNLLAQDLKPKRDRATKKMGYMGEQKGQWVIEPKFDKANKFVGDAAVAAVDGRYGIINKAGEWVLEPSYDGIDNFKKNGLCRLMGKDSGSGRMYGVANSEGKVVLPLHFTAINIDKKYDVVMGKRNIVLDGAVNYEDKRIQMWGLYDRNGEELVTPQFSSAPSFINGYSSVTSAYTGLEGVIDLSGNFTIPVQNLSIKRQGTKYLALTSDFVWVEYDENFNPSSSYKIPGYVIPYDTENDDIKAITYGKLRMGEALHRNELKLAEIGTSRSIHCQDLPIDWGEKNLRFVRLELVPNTEDNANEIIDTYSGKSYTVAARLYEPDGSFVQELSHSGWIEGVCAECVVYCTESGEQWAVMTDINNTGAQSFSSRMTNYKTINDQRIQSLFGLNSSDERTLRSWSKCRELHMDVMKKQSVGITSYSPIEVYEPELESELRRMENWPLMKREFLIGEVLSASFTKPKQDQTLAELKDELIVHFTDAFSDSGYKAAGDEKIYWGPQNGRFVKVQVIPIKAEKRKLVSPDKADDIFDDVFNTRYAYKLALNMYEEDGTFLRCLGESSHLGFAHGGTILLMDLGIVLVGEGSRQFHNGQKIPFMLPHSATCLSQVRTLRVEREVPHAEADPHREYPGSRSEVTNR